ncbi:hypothetical protein E2P81_ATG10403 [Venturia nashicola]|nr:hypothetical protein E2P81_ATG10403 [Venturia nashicola]
MDLLQSLIVPPAEFGGISNAVNSTPQSCKTYHRHDTPVEGTSSATSSIVQKACPAGPQESGTARSRRRKRNKQKQKQRRREEKQQQQSGANRSKKPAVPAPSEPVSVKKARKLSKYQLFHPDRPKRNAGRRVPVSYEDLYDDNVAQQAPLSLPGRRNQAASKSNPASSQTCFFWYHGSCKRAQDRRGCNLRHALLDPPGMIEAPPGFVHPTTCELQWCAGDGNSKEQKARRVDFEEQKRYFEAAVLDDESDGESGSETAEDEMDFFLEGFDDI